MFRFLCRRAITVFPDRVLAQLGFLQNTIFSIRLLSSVLHVEKRSRKAKDSGQEQSLTVSYLINSCGLSLESAISASKKLELKSTENADSVLRLLSDHGFNNTQISKVVRVCPQLIVLDPKRILLPKIEFFRSIGVSRNELVKIISTSPYLLATSLQNHLTPNYNFLKNLLFRDEKVVRVLTRNSRSFLVNLGSNMTPNIALLKEIGVPQSQISFLVTIDPCAACCRHSKFCNIVNEVKEMGFNPARVTFVLAIDVIFKLNKSVWDSKIKIYESWGWSKDETIAAFRKHPQCMIQSERKITGAMDFLVNKTGWLSQDIAKTPVVLTFSLEKRIVPRCSVVQVLLSKGLIKEDICLTTFLLPSEEKFMEKYVTKFQEEIPQLLNVYLGKIDPLDVSTGFQRSVK